MPKRGHLWTDEEIDFLQHVSLGLTRPIDFEGLANLFRVRFPKRIWTSNMLVGKTNRLEHRYSRKSLKQPHRVPQFEPTPLLLPSPERSEAMAMLFAPITGMLCKWPLANGCECGRPANGRGYCVKHDKTVKRCVATPYVDYEGAI